MDVEESADIRCNMCIAEQAGRRNDVTVHGTAQNKHFLQVLQQYVHVTPGTFRHNTAQKEAYIFSKLAFIPVLHGVPIR